MNIYAPVRALLHIGFQIIHNNTVKASDFISFSRNSKHQRPVPLMRKITLKKSEGIFQGLLILGAHQKSAGIHVQTVAEGKIGTGEIRS